MSQAGAEKATLSILVGPDHGVVLITAVDTSEMVEFVDGLRVELITIGFVRYFKTLHPLGDGVLGIGEFDWEGSAAMADELPSEDLPVDI